MPTFTLPDPYEGWPEDRLKERIHDLAAALHKWQMIAINAAAGGMDALTEQSQADVRRLQEAYSD